MKLGRRRSFNPRNKTSYKKLGAVLAKRVKESDFKNKDR